MTTQDVSQGLQVRGLFKSYGDNSVVRDLHLDVPAGAITCLLGKNGAGKTTTMSCLLGLREADAGEILLDGAPLGRDDSAMEAFGFMPEEPALYEHLTAQEFLEFVGELYRVGRDRFRWLDERLAAFDLLERRDHLIREYSKGMKRKLSFLAATIHDPKVLVLDEPTGGLDAHSARVLKDQLQEERANGKVILFSTHIMELAERMADRVAILDDGRIVMEGSPADLVRASARSRTLEDVFLRVTASGVQEG